MSTSAGDVAVWTVIVAATAVFVNAATSIFLHIRRARFDAQLAKRKFDLDLALAERKVSLDLAAADRKRAQDLAEEVLSGFYEVARMMPAIRSPATWNHEGKSRPRPEGEQDSIASLRDTYYAIVERLDRNREVIARLLSKQFRVQAVFGTEATGPFEELNGIVSRITTSARMLIMTAGQTPPPSHTKWQSDIWADWGKVDEVSASIDAMIADVERIFRPALATKPPTPDLR